MTAAPVRMSLTSASVPTLLLWLSSVSRDTPTPLRCASRSDEAESARTPVTAAPAARTPVTAQPAQGMPCPSSTTGGGGGGAVEVVVAVPVGGGGGVICD